jgi:plasmid stabilization system protein ParE
MDVVIRPLARKDILSQFRYYVVECAAANVAQRFLDGVEASIEQIRVTPEIGVRKALENRIQ